MTDQPLLQVRDLEVTYRTGGTEVPALRGVSLDIAPGEVVAVVGESGSGKSTLAHAVVGLLAPNASVGAGSVVLGRDELLGRSERALRPIRGRRIGLVPQDPTVSLNPVQRVGRQVAEALRVHGLASRRGARLAAIDLLGRAGLPEPHVRAGQYPHELSGGMRQRVLIAIAIAAGPALLIADEPTSALDATVQKRILDHLEELTRETGTAVLLVTHDLGVAADRADRIAVMSGGLLVEQGPTARILAAPTDPYTRKLLAAAPGLTGAPARVVVPARRAPTEDVDPTAPPLVSVQGLVKDFPLPRSAGRDATQRAVDDVSFDIWRGETLALVGESGSGKSTTARLVLRLADPTAGTVTFDGTDVTRLRGEAWRALRRRAQLVYQNPYASLDPRFTVTEVIAEPLRAFTVGTAAQQRSRAADLVDRVALPVSVLDRRPAELSGGQRQRVAIARALALEPDLVVCDEPVSALDVSVQAQVLDLLAELQAEQRLAYLFISHDLAVVRRIAHRVGVMRDGKLLELAPTEELFAAPREDYTRELLAAVAGSRTRKVEAAS
ncbi:ABC transporter ATP-binding protein [Pseudonocardia sp. N23]|uniref:dipeptide ABC transporter ATP-binding protein n=1 Tax=Pseudonocardia sp. N23 TaxID=1987376 RepID=UPI000BFD7124|nr:ABC transporter ATP-binding protein [Pseudonocardia sp. N23]